MTASLFHHPVDLQEKYLLYAPALGVGVKTRAAPRKRPENARKAPLPGVKKNQDRRKPLLSAALRTPHAPQAIVACLDAFADARRGRYANFSELGDPDLGTEEPISEWWNQVAKEILWKHYYGTRAQERIERNAQIVNKNLSPFAIVQHTDEQGRAMTDVLTASIHTGKTEIVQRFGRYHTLTVVRWLSDIFSQITQTACVTQRHDAFFGVSAFVATYLVDNRSMKTRKTWPSR